MSIISILILTITFIGTTMQVMIEFKKLYKNRNTNKTIERARKFNGQFAKDIGVTYTSLRKDYNLNY